MKNYLYSRTGHFKDFERQSKVCSKTSSGTKVQLVVAVEIFKQGMEGSILLIAVTIPVSSNSIDLPPNLINLHLWGETVRAPSGNLSTSLSSNKKVNSFSHCQKPHMKVFLSLIPPCSDISLVDLDLDIIDTESTNPRPKVEFDPNNDTDDVRPALGKGIPFDTIRSKGLYRSSYSISFV